MTLPACTSTLHTECAPTDCRWRCALQVIDDLLRQGRNVVSGEEADLLLDLRWRLHRGEDADAALRLFCDLRRRMEHRHYLAFFRIRRWLENHMMAAVRICPAAEAVYVPIKLDYYCIEAVRRVCLCHAIKAGAALLAPRLTFVFRTPVEAIPAPVQDECLV